MSIIRHHQLTACSASQRNVSAPVDLPPPPSEPSLRVGLATLYTPNADNPCTGGIGCALLPWCLSARRLRQALLSRTMGPPDVQQQHAGWKIDLLAIVTEGKSKGATTNQAQPHDRGATCHMSNRTEQLDPSDCPGLRQIVPGAQMQLAVQRHIKRVIASGLMSYNVRARPGTTRDLTSLHAHHALRPVHKTNALSAHHALSATLPHRAIVCSIIAPTCARCAVCPSARLQPGYMRRMGCSFFKWELLRRYKYDAILFTDLDVDLLPTAPHAADLVRREWARRLPELIEQTRGGGGGGGGGSVAKAAVRPPVHVVGYGDPTSPWVAGLFWVFPPRDRAQAVALYREGLRVLQAPWDGKRGWNRTGERCSTLCLLHPSSTPLIRSRHFALATLPSPVSVDGDALYLRAGTPAELWGDDAPQRYADGQPTGQPLLHRRGFRPGWDQIDGGDLEQGLFLYVLWYLYPSLYSHCEQGSGASGAAPSGWRRRCQLWCHCRRRCAWRLFTAQLGAPGGALRALPSQAVATRARLRCRHSPKATR